jgi:hypothetical protein
METKTLQELRALAKARGLKGYSKLTKHDLLALLGKARPVHEAAKPAKTAAAPKRATHKPAPAAAPHERDAAPGKTPATAAEIPIVPESGIGEEERVEGAKYAVVPPGTTYTEPRRGPDLREDIDHLPDLREPMLCLLPQKPGVVHGYWRIPPGTPVLEKHLRLRLGWISGEMFHKLEEVAVGAPSGHWYFHLSEGSDYGGIYLQIGYYDGNRFITAFRRGIARIPSLYPSDRTDRQWWISDEQFRAMYLRAGGILREGKLGWKTSVSSPAGAPGALHGVDVPTPWGAPSGGISGLR